MAALKNQKIAGEYLGVIRDVSNYLSALKDMGGGELKLSQKRLDAMNSWGKSPANDQNFTLLDSWEKIARDLARLSPPPVLSQGDPRASLFLVADGDGTNGQSPYAGKEGDLLLKILGAMNLSKEEIFFSSFNTHAVDHAGQDRLNLKIVGDIIRRQIRLVSPKVICLMGDTASELILQKKEPVRGIRGRFLGFQGISVMVTHHPAELIRNVALKRPVWEDMKMIMAFLKERRDG